MTDPFALYRQAVTHRSWAEERGGLWNERLEFLGDAVLEVCVSELLFAAWPQATEGELTAMRQHLVQNDVLSQIAAELDLGSVALLGRGEAASGGEKRDRLLADLVEALLGAVYLDQGFETAREVIRALWGERARTVSHEPPNPKQALQQLAQQQAGAPPDYRVVGRQGPDHDPTFTVEAIVGGEVVGAGEGASKKLAQKAAALDALRRMQGGSG